MNIIEKYHIETAIRGMRKIILSLITYNRQNGNGVFNLSITVPLTYKNGVNEYVRFVPDLAFQPIPLR